MSGLGSVARSPAWEVEVIGSKPRTFCPREVWLFLDCPYNNSYTAIQIFFSVFSWKGLLVL